MRFETYQEYALKIQKLKKRICFQTYFERQELENLT